MYYLFNQHKSLTYQLWNGKKLPLFYMAIDSMGPRTPRFFTSMTPPVSRVLISQQIFGLIPTGGSQESSGKTRTLEILRIDPPPPPVDVDFFGETVWIFFWGNDVKSWWTWNALFFLPIVPVAPLYCLGRTSYLSIKTLNASNFFWGIGMLRACWKKPVLD